MNATLFHVLVAAGALVLAGLVFATDLFQRPGAHRRIFALVVGLDILIIILHLIFYTENHRLFNMRYERNIPTLYSACQLLLAGIIALQSYRSDLRNGTRRWPLLWIIMAGFFFYIASDEALRLHEMYGKFMAGRYNLDVVNRLLLIKRPMGTAWVVFGFPMIVLGLVWLYSFGRIRFARKAEGGIWFYAGIVLFAFVPVWEVLESRARGGDGILWPEAMVAEELFEMLGASFFLYAFLCYWRNATAQRDRPRST